MISDHAPVVANFECSGDPTPIESASRTYSDFATHKVPINGLITHGAGHARRTTQVTAPAREKMASRRHGDHDGRVRAGGVASLTLATARTGPAHTAVIESAEAKPAGADEASRRTS